MKKNILFVVISTLLLMAPDTQAQEEWYPEESSCPEEGCCLGDQRNFYAKVFRGANFLKTLQSTEINPNTIG